MDNHTQIPLPGGIVGNGNMLACIQPNGILQKLFWPHIDWGQHMGTLWVGILEPSQQKTLWLHESGWQYSQYYQRNTNTLITEMILQDNVTIKLMDMVDPEKDLLLRSYTITNLQKQPRTLQFVTYTSFTIDESDLFDGMYVDLQTGFLVQYKQHVFLGISVPGYPLYGFHCGRKHTPSDPYNAASKGEFWGGKDNIKSGASAMCWDIGVMAPGEAQRVDLYVAAAPTAYDLTDLLFPLTPTESNTIKTKTTDYWNKWLSTSSVTQQAKLQSFAHYNRSLLTLKLLSDKDGGFLAAPEFDPQYTVSGGYGYCWPRDGMFVAVALDEAGYHQEAAMFYRFAKNVQCPDGGWQQRYWMNGDWGSSWGRQNDQTGAVLWGYFHHYQATQDKNFLKEIWSSTLAGAEHLRRHVFQKNNLPLPGMDLWEDTFSQNTYTAAAVWGGLHGAAKIASLCQEPAYAQQWNLAAQQLKEGILTQLFCQEKGIFTRSIHKKVSWEEFQQARNQGRPVQEMLTPDMPYALARDYTLDSATLGLCFPFGVLEPDHPYFLTTMQEIQNHLHNEKVGGLHRYQWDRYAGGNPWMISTLWLSICLSLKGDSTQAEKLIRWAEKNASSTGLLPEQVNQFTDVYKRQELNHQVLNGFRLALHLSD